MMMTHIYVQSREINAEEIWFKCNFRKSNIQWQVLKVLGLKRLTMKEFNQVTLRSYNTKVTKQRGVLFCQKIRVSSKCTLSL